jgi:pimeloyl-ACP methyl ester carboxylesterase
VTVFLADTADDLVVIGPSARFTYRRLGPRGDVPLVLVQRFRGTIDWWDPEFVDYLAAERDVILFDNVGIGRTTGEPRSSVAGFADGTIEFIEALGLTTVDLLGWSLGGIVAQTITHQRPELIRKLVVAGSAPVGPVPGQPDMDTRVLSIMTKPDADAEDLLYLFYPETEAGRAAGLEHIAKVSTRLAVAGPPVSEEAALGQLQAVAEILAVPFDVARATLEAVTQPVLYANGVHDVMIPALASYVAVQHLNSATLVLYSDAGHAFLFQHAKSFATEVNNFLA